MRDPRFVHIGIGADFNFVDQDELKRVIESESFDWMRYSFACYMLWTSSDNETIVRKLMRVPGLNPGNIFAVEINITTCFGILSPALWEWLKKDRGQGALPFYHAPFWPPLLK